MELVPVVQRGGEANGQAPLDAVALSSWARVIAAIGRACPTCTYAEVEAKAAELIAAAIANATVPVEAHGVTVRFLWAPSSATAAVVHL